LVYVSYFLGNPGSTEVTSEHVFGSEVGGTDEPVFKKIYINTLDGYRTQEQEEQKNKPWPELPYRTPEIPDIIGEFGPFRGKQDKIKNEQVI
jgi:hypothetical protein